MDHEQVQYTDNLVKEVERSLTGTSPVPALSDNHPLATAITDLCVAYVDRNVLPEFSGSVAQLDTVWRKHCDSETETIPVEVWKTLQEVLILWASSFRPRPKCCNDTAKDLLDRFAGTMRLEQVAKMLDFKDERGDWDLPMVQRAYLDPGKYDGEVLYNKHLERNRQLIAEDVGQIEEACSPWHESSAAVLRIDPTPLAELIAQGVSGKQIGKMKGLTLTEVNERAAALGLPIPPPDYQSPAATRGAFEPSISAAVERVMSGGQTSGEQAGSTAADGWQDLPEGGDEDTLRDRCRRLLREGRPHGEIASLIGHDRSRQWVTAIAQKMADDVGDGNDEDGQKEKAGQPEKENIENIAQ